MSDIFTRQSVPVTGSRQSLASPMRYTIAFLTLVAMLTLSACGSATSQSATTDAATAQATRLALGTLELENTGQAVSADLAGQLLPLWQLLAELNTNAAAAPQETLAVVEQIQTTMTADQVSAIAGMQLPENALANAAGSTTSAAATASSSLAPAAMPVDAQLGGGPPPDAAGGFPLGGDMPAARSASVSGSAGATASGAASSNRSSIALFQQVINLLESKLQG